MEEKKRTIKDVSKVKQTEEGIIIEIVENCKTGKCDCMSEEAKKKINFMDFRVKEGKPIIEIKGDISKEEIQKAMEKSKKEL